MEPFLVEFIMSHKAVWRLAITLILAVSLWLISPLTAEAQDIQDYFQLSYDPVSFSKNEIHGSEDFHATVRGRATCTEDLPVSPGEASITSRIIAKHAVSGAAVTLNPGYTVTIKPFPSKKGDTIEINEEVPLKFPAQAEPGDYNIIGELIEAKVKIAFAWGEVTEYLPRNQPMGSVKHTAAEPAQTPAPAPTNTQTPTTTPTPVSTPASEPVEEGMPWWVWLIVVIAVVTTVMNIIWFLRRRAA